MTIRKWAVVIGTDVAGTITIDDQNPMETVQRFVAAYDSDPKIVPIHTEQDVKFGWAWDGSSFIEPGE